MTHEVIQFIAFTNAAKRLGLTAEDVREIELQIMAAPEAGPVIAGTSGLRKVRFASSSRAGGKSGGVRVCYFVIMSASHLYLMTAFGKNEQGNLTPRERNAMGVAITAIKKAYERKKS